MPALVVSLDGASSRVPYSHSQKSQSRRVEFPEFRYMPKGSSQERVERIRKTGATVHMTDVSAPLGIQVPGVKAASQLSAKIPSFIWVDQDGCRFVNEKGIDGHTQITAVTFYDAVKHRFPRNPCWMIFDDPACKAGPIYGSARSGYALNRENYKWSEDNSEEIKKGVIIKADTIEALAEKLKMPKLVETVKKWNEDIRRFRLCGAARSRGLQLPGRPEEGRQVPRARRLRRSDPAPLHLWGTRFHVDGRLSGRFIQCRMHDLRPHRRP